MKYLAWVFYLVFVGFMVVPPLTYYWFVDGFPPIASLENWSFISQIVTAIALGIGLLTYGYQKDHDRRLSVVQQVNFFREVIIKFNEELISYIFTVLNKEKDRLTPIQEIHKFSFTWLTEHHLEKSLEQNGVLLKIQDAKGKIEYKSPFIKLLNALEELSISIELNDTANEPGLTAIRKVFVELVEFNVMAMMTTNSYDQTTYAYTKKVYKKWYRKIDRKTSDQVQELFKEEVKEGRKRRDAKTRGRLS